MHAMVLVNLTRRHRLRLLLVLLLTCLFTGTTYIIMLQSATRVLTGHRMYRGIYQTTSRVMSSTAYKAQDRGAPFTLDYRQYFEHNGSPISPWHDIPLLASGEGTNNQTFNMVCEVPRWSNAKMEIATSERLNPIKQDTKKGKLRFVNNIFPHHGYIWNYGALPQTWEDPMHKHPDTQANGDNDPIDVCEIGQRIAKRGDVYAVKILGTIALIDEGETDWKLIAIDVRDPLAQQMSDITDVEKHFPGLLESTREWFRLYKVPTGKPENKFGFNAEYKNRDYAVAQILETHTFWKALIGKSGEGDGGLDTKACEAKDAANKMTNDEARQVIDSAPAAAHPAEVDVAEIHQWHFVK